jgi:hypothetical protein
MTLGAVILRIWIITETKQNVTGSFGICRIVVRITMIVAIIGIIHMTFFGTACLIMITSVNKPFSIARFFSMYAYRIAKHRLFALGVDLFSIF